MIDAMPGALLPAVAVMLLLAGSSAPGAAADAAAGAPAADMLSLAARARVAEPAVTLAGAVHPPEAKPKPPVAPLVPDLTLSPSAPTEPPPEPDGYRMDDFRSTVPATLKGAKVLTPDEAADLWNGNGAVFIDVYPQAPKPPNLPAGTFWRDPPHRSIEGAHWLANVGYGALSPQMEAFFRLQLERLAKGKRDAPLVFFCLKDCWMSWNAAKRALEYGYTNVMWFRDGTDGWQELGYPLADVQKVK